VIDLSPSQVGLATLLIAIVVAISTVQALRLERDLLIASVRTVAQLYLVGLILAAVFAAAHWYWTILILLIMMGVATQAAVSRLEKPVPGQYGIAAIALGASSAFTLAYVLGAVVRVEPWYTPQYIIPIAGMIVGNAMTSAALAGDRLQSDLRTRLNEVEAMLALGFSGREAVQPMIRTALRAAMIPTVSGMMTVGLVQLPGMMTGQILAGSSPLLAIKYQVMIVFALAAATALASLLFVRLAARRYLTGAHQLRRYLL
jgi:UDP-glucose/iron transport system permease protein